MARLRVTALTLVAAVAIALTSAPAASAAKRAPCASSGSKTVMANERARIFTKRGTAAPNYRVRRLYGCLYRRDARFRLSILGEPGIFVTAVPHIRLAGNMVGYAEEYEGPAGGNYGQIKVRSLRTGGQLFSVTAAQRDEDTIRTTAVTDLEIRATGAAAWIARVGHDSPTHQVHMRSAGGTRTMLDEGADIDPSSLALSGSTLYWTRGGVPRSAVLR